MDKRMADINVNYLNINGLVSENMYIQWGS